MTRFEQWKENRLQKLYKEIDDIEKKAKKAKNKIKQKIDDINAMGIDDVIVKILTSDETCIHCAYSPSDVEDCMVEINGTYDCINGVERYLLQEVQDE